MKNRIWIPLLLASVVSVAGAQALRYGFVGQLGSYTLLAVGILSFLSYAIAFACAGKDENAEKKAPTLRKRLCGALTVTGGFLLAVPLLRLGKMLGEKIAYAFFVPATLAENGVSGLLLFCVLPIFLLTVALLAFALPLFLRLGLPESTVCPLIGLLAALLFADPLKGVVYFLLGSVLAFVACKVGRGYAVLLAAVGAFLFTLFENLPFESAAPTAAKTVGMLLLFAGFVLPMWVYGGGYLMERKPPKGILAGSLWIAAALLAVCGCAIVAYAG